MDNNVGELEPLNYEILEKKMFLKGLQEKK